MAFLKIALKPELIIKVYSYIKIDFI